MIKPFRGDFQLTQTWGNKFFLNGVDVYAQYGLKGHDGLDYGLPSGTQIIAPHNGKIIEVADQGNTGYGKYIKIENDKGGSVLAHLQTFQVKVGDTVSEGQPIALSDNTGNSTGPHLHWGYYLFPRNRGNGYAGFIDQMPFLTQPTPPQTDLQKQLDEMRKQRDANWNLYQASLNDVKKLTEEKKQLQDVVNVLNGKINQAKNILNG